MAGKAPFIQLKFHFSLSFFLLCGNYWKSFQWTLIVILFCVCQGLCYGLATPKGPKHYTGEVTTDLKPKHFFFHFSGFCFAKKGLLSHGTKWTDVQQVNRIIFGSPAVVPAVSHCWWPPPVELLLLPIQNQVIFMFILWGNLLGDGSSVTLGLEANAF